MGNHHEHHDHGNTQSKNTLVFEDKAAKLIDHWIQHNNDHGQSYTRWAKEFSDHGFHEAAQLLLTAQELTLQITETLTQAAEKVPGAPNAGSGNER